MNTIPFKIIAISHNTNSFGLNQIILTSRTGETWKVCKYLGIPEEKAKWSLGNVIDVPTDDVSASSRDWHLLGVEIPRRHTPDMPPKLLRQTWPEDHDPNCALCQSGEEPRHEH